MKKFMLTAAILASTTFVMAQTHHDKKRGLNQKTESSKQASNDIKQDSIKIKTRYKQDVADHTPKMGVTRPHHSDEEPTSNFLDAGYSDSVRRAGSDKNQKRNKK